MTVYKVRKNRVALLDEFRGDRITGDVYTIFKDGEPSYEVTVSTLGDWCNCPAGRNHGRCKHTSMVYEYRAEVGESFTTGEGE